MENNNNSIQQKAELKRKLPSTPPPRPTSGSLAPNGHTNPVGRELVLQKIRIMKEKYMPFCRDMYKKILSQLQSSGGMAKKAAHIDTYKKCKIWLESLLNLFDRPPSNLPPDLTEERLSHMEARILNFIKVNGTKKTVFQSQQLQPSGAHSLQTQIPQLQCTDNQMSTLMQVKRSKSSAPAMQPKNSFTTLQHNSMSSLSSHLIGSTQPNLVHTERATLQAACPLSSHYSSPQAEQRDMMLIPPSLSKSESLLLPSSSSMFSLSPSSSLASSHMPSEHERSSSSICSSSNVLKCEQKQTVSSGLQFQPPVIHTPAISTSSLQNGFASPDNNQDAPSTANTGETEKPIERLIKAVTSISHEAFKASVSEINLAANSVDIIEEPNPGSPNKAFRRFLTVVSSDGSVNRSFNHGLETSDLESTATSRSKREGVEVNQTLSKEIEEINMRLINTVLDISQGDTTLSSVVSAVGQGTIVRCTFTALTERPDQLVPVLPINLLVSSNYPNCSPILLDGSPISLSLEHDLLLVKARSQFTRSLRCHSEPISLKEMATTWDKCAREVILDYAVKKGGGSFSTRFGSWKTL